MRTQRGFPATEHLKHSRALFLHLLDEVRALDQKLVQQYRDARNCETVEIYILKHLLAAK